MSEQLDGGVEQFDLRDLSIVTQGGQPAIEFPSGDRLRLRVHVSEWSLDKPTEGEVVEMDAEVDADEYAWWMLHPERCDISVPASPEDYPEIVIEPEIVEGDRDE